MEPSQDAGQGGRTRASSRRGARAVEDGAGERGRGVDKVARGTVACAGAAERERTLRASNDPATVAAAEKGPGGDKAMVHKNAVEDGAGERGRSINKVARGTVACAVEKGAVERDCTLRASNAPATVAAAEKGPGGDKAMVHKGLDKNEGRFIYNAEVDSYTLEPIGTKEKRPYILPGNIYRYLFEYQQEGIAWLWGIHCQQNGAIVADDMGLGKTFQAAAFLSGLFRSDLVNASGDDKWM